jgi:hypothetical protein
MRHTCETNGSTTMERKAAMARGSWSIMAYVRMHCTMTSMLPAPIACEYRRERLSSTTFWIALIRCAMSDHGVEKRRATGREDELGLKLGLDKADRKHVG